MEKLNFASDNVQGVHPDIMEALCRANHGSAASYGSDACTAEAKKRLCEVFETELEVYLVATGTAANALALSALTPPYGAIFCHEEAHIAVDECGAVELYSGGAKLICLKGEQGKITTQAVLASLSQFVRGEHNNLPAAISLTQLTELGTLYALDDVRAFAELARGHGMALHMDGARFANALAALKCSPADMTWKAGVDVLSFGGTKNGGLALEAVIFFNHRHTAEFSRRRMRAGQLLSKGRFLGAQMVAYLQDDLWLKNAAHANGMAQRLAAGMSGLEELRLPLLPPANELFPVMSKPVFDTLQTPMSFHAWPGQGPGPHGSHEVVGRFVTSFATSAEEIERAIGIIRQAAK